MIEIRKTKHNGVCNSCGTLEDVKQIYDLRFSTDAIGFNTVMICGKCMAKLNNKIVRILCK